MLVDTPQICWHGGEAGKAAPILSLDTHPLALVDQTRGERPAGAAGTRFILATAGTDAEVRLWVVNQPTREDARNWEQPGLSGRMQSFVASLGGHQRGVNVVRFSPDGLSLASASDGGTVVIWSVDTLTAWSTVSSDRDTKKMILRGATEDIYDMSWSPESRYLACGSIDRRAHIWEVTTKRSIAILEDHANYVQGTAWDPLCKYMATQSSDRSCRVYHITHDGTSGPSGAGRLAVKCCNVIKSCLVPPDDASGEAPRMQEGSTVSAERSAAVDSETGAATTLPGAEGSDGSRADEKDATRAGTPAGRGALAGTASCAQAQGNGVGGKGRGFTECACSTDTESTTDKAKPVQRKNLFVDETVTSFSRRLCWSPDGAFLITPTAQHWDAATKKTQFCTYLFKRGQFVKPSVCLPGLNKPSVAVRCNPRLFSLKGRVDGTDSESMEPPMCDLPYRAVFAVVSLDAVVVYDTEHLHPLTVATGLHYSGLTDACWSSDGLSLFVSSTDGYVSKIHFEQEELGLVIPESEVPSQTRRSHPVIYGWTAHAEETAGRISTATPRPVSDECQASTPREKGNDLAKTGDPGKTGPDTTTSKPKKKIVPTLVTTGDIAQRDVEPVPPMAVSPSPTFPSGERKKRRITPTLVHGASCTEDGDAMPGAQGGVNSTPVAAEEAQKNTLSAATHVPGSGLDQTTKKKRLAPTLVSAL